MKKFLKTDKSILNKEERKKEAKKKAKKKVEHFLQAGKTILNKDLDQYLKEAQTLGNTKQETPTSSKNQTKKPKNQKSEKKLVAVSFSKADYDFLIQKAKENRLSLSAFIRLILFQKIDT